MKSLPNHGLDSSPKPEIDGPGFSPQELAETVYPELRRIARGMMLRERAGHTLQPTALVHEAIIRILGFHSVQIQSTRHFFCLAIAQMRRVLASYARRKLAHKRSGTVRLEADFLYDSAGIDINHTIIVDQVLDRLAALDPRAHAVVMLRFFGALSPEETAAVLGISVATVHRDWVFARPWLYAELR